ncbi:MAG: TonB-dependent receptor [Hydrogenobaculum sp.]
MKIRLACIFSLAMVSFAFAETPLLNVEVNANKTKENTPSKLVKTTKYTKAKEKVEKPLINKLTSSGGGNVFQALELLPSVNFQTQDPYGLSGGQITIRGFNNNQIGLTIDGMPLMDSGNYALYPNEYMDLENLEAETITRGGTGKASPLYSDLGGRIALRTIPPKDKLSLELEQIFGSYAFEKSFVRLDSGLLPLMNSKFFISFSHAQANKWKGPGQNPKFRDHVAFGWVANLNRLHIDFYMDENDQVNYYYRGLNYQQAQNLSAYKDFDYNGSLTGNPAVDQYYYKFFHNPYQNYEFRGDISFDVSRNFYVDLKPYYWRGRGGGSSAYYNSRGNYINYGISYNYTKRPGFIAQAVFHKNPFKVTAGFWYERADLENFSTNFKLNNFQNGNYNTTFNYYGYIDKVYTTTQTPYVIFDLKDFHRFDVELGLKYAQVKRDYKEFNTNNLPYLPDDDIYNYPLSIIPSQSYVKTYRKFLPSINIGYKINRYLYPYFNYAKNFQVPASYQGSPPKGTTTQEIINNLSPEEADSYDAGVNITLGKFIIKPDIYYVDYKNKIVYFAEPNNPNITYPQSVGKVKAYGGELEILGNLIKNLTLISSFSYNRAKFDNGYYSGKTFLNVAGNQLPNTPKYMGKLGLDYKLYGFDIFPYLIYESSRYGDSTNQQEIPSYVVANLNVSRDFNIFGKKFYGFLNVLNLTNKTYIGYIGTGDTSGTYYVAPPITVSAGLRAYF